MRAVGRWSWLLSGGRARVVSVACAGLIAAGALGHVTVDQLSALPEEAVLRVRETTVTEDDFRQRIDVLGALYGVEQPPEGPQRDAFRRDAAQAVATSVVIDQVASQQGIGVSDGDARAALDKIIQDKFPEGREQFNQALSNLRVSERDVLGEIRRQLTASRVFDNVTEKAASVSDAEVRRAYDERKQQWGAPETRRLRNIVLDSQEKAQQARLQADSGTDFTELASQKSMDKSTADKGGDLGIVSAAQLEPPVAEAAFSAPAGGTFGPVQGRFGWNVGQVLEVHPPEQPTFEEVREQVRAQLVSERKLAAWRPWLSSQIREAGVEYADDYRPSNPAGLPPGVAR